MENINITAEEKELRKQLKLPITKPLRYMRRRNGSYAAIPVVNLDVEEAFETWSTLCITLENGEAVKIHSAYFAEMQKPSFEKDMAKQEEADE